MGDCLATIAGRVVYAGSKLALSQQWKNSALWELCGTEGPVDVDLHCYAAMDRLLARQKAIERTLAQRHLKEGHLVLYDIASSYFEGAYAESELVLFGYDRDGKRRHEQMVMALVCNEDGCPVGGGSLSGKHAGRFDGSPKDCADSGRLRSERNPLRGGSRDDDAGECPEGSRDRGAQHDLDADVPADRVNRTSDSNSWRWRFGIRRPCSWKYGRYFTRPTIESERTSFSASWRIICSGI